MNVVTLLHTRQEQAIGDPSTALQHGGLPRRTEVLCPAWFSFIWKCATLPPNQPYGDLLVPFLRNPS